MAQHALIFANGDANDGEMLRRVLDSVAAPLIVAADGGARVALHYGFTPHIVLGDMDSLPPDELNRLAASGTVIQRYPPEKEETDLEIALKWAAGQAVAAIHIIGGIGDRLDQTLANIYLLALPELHNIETDFLAGRQSTRLWEPGIHTLNGAPGDTVSLIPMGTAVHGVTTENMYYPLTDETLMFGPARGISNVMLTDRARVKFQSGALLVVHTIGKA